MEYELPQACGLINGDMKEECSSDFSKYSNDEGNPFYTSEP